VIKADAMNCSTAHALYESTRFTTYCTHAVYIYYGLYKSRITLNLESRKKLFLIENN